MTSVATSEVPWGAAITRPARPFSAWTSPFAVLDGGASVVSAGSLPVISPAQPDERRARPIPRLARPRLVIGGVADQHRLRHRILAVVGQREQDAPASLRLGDLPASAAQHHRRRLTPLPPHLQLSPVHAHAEPGAQGLEGGLLGREAGGQVRDGIAAPAAVGDLVLGEHALQEALVPARHHPPHARHLREVHADAQHPTHPPMACRTMAASPRMGAWPSLPSTPPSTDSWPDYGAGPRPPPASSSRRPPAGPAGPGSARPAACSSP